MEKGSKDFEEDQVHVRFGYAVSTEYNGSYSNLEGLIEGGIHKPFVNIQGIGFANVTAEAKTFKPEITEITPNVGGVYGGIEVKIVGKYFSNSKKRI